MLDITNWNFAIDEWCCPSAEINLVVGGKFNYRMEATNGSLGFDFAGEFSKIERHKSIHYKLEDNRQVKIVFIESENATKVVEIFEAENENSVEQQRQGWFAILSNTKCIKNMISLAG
jgi:uncharacterized protein YndB with AHSA1/START domain